MIPKYLDAKMPGASDMSKLTAQDACDLSHQSNVAFDVVDVVTMKRPLSDTTSWCVVECVEGGVCFAWFRIE